jgi:hypothetical protein
MAIIIALLGDSAMTKLLHQAFAEAAKLTQAEQNPLASRHLAELAAVNLRRTLRFRELLEALMGKQE